ncbi:hypothetical protein BDP27DRAFT_1415500 [Rhodocollybia butyracea]|uniref:Uncharacterized protein n=1 Tax=Rhodocollybia butyracea TaxID=206335 RepID=A0A9P5UDG1_9AGAR|nr:hypothetical protein BDP27DRAFT_1415500 [Rhodocollybia butyracea]
MLIITAIVIGTFLEVLLYGVYVATFIRHVQILVRRQRKLPPKTFIYLSTASLLLFVIATITMVADLNFATHIILKNPTGPDDFSGYVKKRDIKIVCGSFAIMVSDTVLLYRLYILYGSRLRVVALPLLVFMVQCGIEIWSLISLSQQNNGDPGSSDRLKKVNLPLDIFGFFSTGLNVICTSLILACMWRSHRRLLATGVSNLQSPSAYVRVGAILINSAMINIIWWLSILVTSNVSSIVYQMLDPSYACVTGLIFSTIIVSASRPPSEWESFAPVSFQVPAPRAFPQDSMPSMVSIDLSANDVLEADVQLAESSSLDRSSNGVSPKEAV